LEGLDARLVYLLGIKKVSLTWLQKAMVFI